MPELPEVEVTRQGIAPHLAGRCITGVTIRNAALRWPVPDHLDRTLTGLTIQAVTRRGKYLLIDCGRGTVIVHLGMSGSLRLLPATAPAQKHDHADLLLDSAMVLRLRDPRRFGAIMWETGEILSHPLLAQLGPEPLADGFDGRMLYTRTRKRNASIKETLMNSHIVVGIGNIYASEALFRARIHPKTAAGRIGVERYNRLAAAIRDTLQLAIEAGGSSLRDFVSSNGSPGYFQQQYQVYNRTGQPCHQCNQAIRHIRQGQRSSFYCPHCQK